LPPLTKMRTSVLIPSYGRPLSLRQCLEKLHQQRIPPDEVIVAWQLDDTSTRDAAQSKAGDVQYSLRIVHSTAQGIVPAESAALRYASGEILIFVDDDALPHPEWVARHLAHFADPEVGAVGAPVRNYRSDGSPFAVRRPAHIGQLTSYGRTVGNLFDHPPEWQARPPIDVAHLAAGNMSVRRVAFGDFEASLRPYWQSFELDVCLQVKAHGFRVLFDFANVIEHYPTNSIFTQDRSGDLRVKVFHPAYNHAFILAKHSGWHFRALRLLYLLLVGSSTSPGLAGFCVAVWRYGNIARETSLLCQTLNWHLAGWVAGSKRRRTGRAIRSAILPQKLQRT